MAWWHVQVEDFADPDVVGVSYARNDAFYDNAVSCFCPTCAVARELDSDCVTFLRLSENAFSAPYICFGCGATIIPESETSRRYHAGEDW